eukprot:1150301-Pelagomonas_calceolata.AAC.1
MSALAENPPDPRGFSLVGSWLVKAGPVSLFGEALATSSSSRTRLGQGNGLRHFGVMIFLLAGTI